MKKEIKLDGFKDHIISDESISNFVKENIPPLLEGQKIGWFSFGISEGKHQARVCIYDRRVIHIDPASAKDLDLVTLEYLYLRTRIENILRKHGFNTLSKIFAVNKGLKKYQGIADTTYKELVEDIDHFLKHHEITSVKLDEIM